MISNTKRVKIIKAGRESFWYAKYIGEEFTITYGRRSRLWEAEMPDRNNEIGYIDLEDCEILESDDDVKIVRDDREEIRDVIFKMITNLREQWPNIEDRILSCENLAQREILLDLIDKI